MDRHGKYNPCSVVDAQNIGGYWGAKRLPSKQRDGLGSLAAAADCGRFLRASLQSPFRVGAQLPSRTPLANAMAAAVDPDQQGLVVEFGPGTGAVTEALLRRGIAEERLVLIEIEPRFCELLHRRYPKAQILSLDAFSAPKALRQQEVGPIAAFVSGLPLVNHRRRRRQRLLLDCLKLAEPGSPFIQFTYFYRTPIPVGSNSVNAEVSRLVLRNVWPARVWRYHRSIPAVTN